LENADEHLNHQDKPLLDNFQRLSESDYKLLQKFHSKMNKLSHKFCLMCNECFPLINLVLGMYRRYYINKNEIKKFSAKNNMDPGNIPEKLKGLTDVKEILIAQTFPIVSVYYLHGGQYAYSKNVINFL